MNLQRGRNLPIHHVTKHKKKAQKLAIAGKFFAGLRMLVIVGATKTFGFLCSSSKRGSSLQRS